MSAAVHRCDVAIVGGGMVGASLALALADTRRKVVLIEAVRPQSAAQPSFDDRTTALGNGSRRILETLGVWPEIAAHAAAIRDIHVSDAGHFGFARLHASDHGLDAFGYTVSNRHIGAVLWRALQARSAIQLMSPARVTAVHLSEEVAELQVSDEHQAESLVRSQLVVAADGAHSLVKQACGIASIERDYRQVAVVANLSTDRAARGIAYERFMESGPLALLPLFDGSYTVVWALAPDRAAAMLQNDEAHFCAELQQSFGWRAGRIVRAGPRGSYPLSLVRAQRSAGVRAALIGNAAQTLHPVAAQGFNLGLRDAAVLAELVATAGDPGAHQTLAQFARRRAGDRRGMIAFTDQLVRIFSSHHGSTVAVRNLGLLLFDLAPPAKHALSRLSWGFGRLPRLSRGLPLPRSASS